MSWCTERNLALVESLGAELAVDYAREDFTTRSERYDVILDAVGKRKSAAAMRDAGNVFGAGRASPFDR